LEKRKTNTFTSTNLERCNQKSVACVHNGKRVNVLFDKFQLDFRRNVNKLEIMIKTQKETGKTNFQQGTLIFGPVPV